jgi:hypothetical protein
MTKDKQQMSQKNVWLNMLRIVSLVTVFTGIIASLASHPGTEFLWRFLFNLLKNFDPLRPTLFNQDHHAINAVLGGVMIGWGTLMYLLSAPAVFNEPIRKGFLYSLTAWFICDNIGSLAADLPGNVVLNIAFYSMFYWPLRRLKQQNV